MKFGIDLGTMNSAIAQCDGELDDLTVDLVNLPSADGGYQLRSVVYFGRDGHTVVGRSALEMIVKEPERVIQWIKRDMGEHAPRVLDGRTYTPPEISARILEVLKREAENWADGEPMEGVVLCVPAWFGDPQREATRLAAALAGIPLIDLLSEPSAAALAASMEQPDALADRDILVYDLGGGTFDSVVIRTRRQEGGSLAIETLAMAGDRKLGGHDWDLALARLVAARSEREHGFNPEHEDPREWFFLLDQVESLKKGYGRGNDSVVIPDLRGHHYTVTRDEFLEATEPLLATTAGWVDAVLEEAETKHAVQRADLVVLLCGGASRLPGIIPMLTAKVGHEPLKLRKVDPELMVVRGAAYAARLATAAAAAGAPGPDAAAPPPPLTITDRYRAVGIEVELEEATDDQPGKYGNEVLLPEGSTADVPKTREFAIGRDDQTDLEVVILQGDDPDADRCDPIGTLLVTGLPPGRKAGAVVKVTAWYDRSGILHCHATDESGAEAETTVNR